LIARLRLPEETVFPAGTQIAIAGGTIRTLEPFSMWSSSSDKLDAAVEIERLSARVAVLEQALGLLTTLAPKMEIDPSDPLGMAKTIEATVRAALEAKP
jgi:hypothetical protein